MHFTHTDAGIIVIGQIRVVSVIGRLNAALVLAFSTDAVGCF